MHRIRVVATLLLGVITGLAAIVAVSPAVTVLVGTRLLRRAVDMVDLLWLRDRAARRRHRLDPAVFKVVASVLAGLGAAGLGFAVAAGIMS